MTTYDQGHSEITQTLEGGICMEGLNGADMAFVIFSAALVMLMVPGLALFYGGMVKSKNDIIKLNKVRIAIEK